MNAPHTANETIAPLEMLAQLMAEHPCYAFVANEDCTGAKALFRGRWRWEQVESYLGATPTTVVISNERASGFVRYRLYATHGGSPVCLAEVEVYFARQERTTFWCSTEAAAGNLALAA